MIRVAVVENQVFIRECLVYFLEKNELIEVVIQTGSKERLFKSLQKNEVDLVLIDMVFPSMSGDEICKQLISLYPRIRIMVFSSIHNLGRMTRLISSGVHGYLSRDTNAFQLNNALVSLHKNGFYYDDELKGMIRKVIQNNNTNESDESIAPLELFTEREMEIIKCVLLQLNTHEIAHRLHISPTTVETHRARIIKKTNSKNFMGVLLFVVKHDLLPLHKLWINLCVIGGILLD
ncbi:response regulator transcription factor [Flavobacterium sp. SUN046]|uniref:response regulator transcription factor n=1 Tax=Flavobacterium sp. SUN046 TaxID=3002440 RepID=UPI002DBD978A|nr:response regulator transcription factor [Flavobacterium sp. SUN046]MEC4048260.1 response regulator transcription factor [Flavobacterium sp. SUN046]